MLLSLSLLPFYFYLLPYLLLPSPNLLGDITMSIQLDEEKQELGASEPSGVDLQKIARGVRLILEGIGEDPERPGLQRTPERVAEMYAELTAGMREDPHLHVVPLPGDT